MSVNWRCESHLERSGDGDTTGKCGKDDLRLLGRHAGLFVVMNCGNGLGNMTVKVWSMGRNWTVSLDRNGDFVVGAEKKNQHDSQQHRY